MMFYVCLWVISPVYRQGDIGTSWYAVLSGSLDVKVSETANHQVGPDFPRGLEIKGPLALLPTDQYL